MKRFVFSISGLIYSIVIGIIMGISYLCLKDPTLIMKIASWAMLGLIFGLVIQIMYNIFKPGARKMEIYEYLFTFIVVFTVTALLRLMNISYNRTNWLIGLAINEGVIISALILRNVYYKRLNMKLNHMKGNYVRK